MEPQHQDRYVPAQTNTGWGVATGVILLTAVLIAAVYTIHKRTWKQPTDVTWHTAGDTITGH